jgi:3-deoxy-7-phosphoheptulonate synthase
MLIVMNSGATDTDIRRVVRTIESLGFKAHPMPGANRTAIGLTGNQGAIDPSPFAELPAIPGLKNQQS